MPEITNYDDVIDSRDVIERIEELIARRDDLDDARKDYNERAHLLEPGDQAQLARVVCQCEEEYGEDESAELAALVALAEEAEGYAPDWKYGEALIRDSHFKDYAMELAEDIGAIPKDIAWPCSCIDWDQAARELQMDYTAVDFDGVTYWIR